MAGIDLIPLHTHIRGIISAGNNAIVKFARAVYTQSRRKDGVPAFARKKPRESDNQEWQKTVRLSREDAMPYPTKAVANAILNRAKLDGEKLRPLKLQKLMYYLCGYYLAAYGKPLIDSPIEAWEYGPVVSEIYREFKKFGAQEITSPACELDWETYEYAPVPIPAGDPQFDKVLDYVWKTYGKYTGLQLSEMTHSENSPWDKTRKAKPGIRGADISDEFLISHFKPLVKRKAA